MAHIPNINIVAISICVACERDEKKKPRDLNEQFKATFFSLFFYSIFTDNFSHQIRGIYAN